MCTDETETYESQQFDMTDEPETPEPLQTDIFIAPGIITKSFTTIETFCLLNIYEDNIGPFKKTSQKTVVWDLISEGIKNNKFIESRDTCLNRFTN